MSIEPAKQVQNVTGGRTWQVSGIETDKTQKRL